MNAQYLREKIRSSLSDFKGASLSSPALALFETLGYKSPKRLVLSPNSPENFLRTFDSAKTLNRETSLFNEWEAVDFLFQLTDEEINTALTGQKKLFESAGEYNGAVINSYLFLSLSIRGSSYSRTVLANITRSINKLFPMPVLILFRHGKTLTLSIINRRRHKKDGAKDVLEKVTLIKDICFEKPHRAHIEILLDLSFISLFESEPFSNFVELQNAWQKTLDTKELNKRFYQDIAHWYFWAIQNVYFPGAGIEADKKGLFRRDEKVREHNAKNLIRLLTRLLFVWFIKERGLIPEEIFNERFLSNELLNGFDPSKNRDFSSKNHGSTFYRAILQNLFFATLNQTVGKREFRKPNQHRNVTTLMRYETYFKDPKKFVSLVETTVPFMNGGLFDCLDVPAEEIKGKRGGDVILYEDGFSDRPENDLMVPDLIFFGSATADLSEELGPSAVDVKVTGLINILKAYKFTIAENTPIEEDIALDPELLGQVFENLLASYNPETKVTARKQTGSFYTPREVVNYMVDESLIAYFKNRLEAAGFKEKEPSIRELIGYSDSPNPFSPVETKFLIEAVDHCKILDPACGSGAFPMGALHKFVYVLHKLDPQNELWKKRQIEKAQSIDDVTIRDQLISDIEAAFLENELDYGRKLYLIENCIYGVDIQPVATQISRLRFFISLIVDQKIFKGRENYGVRPLPNLETKFVAANTLVTIKKPKECLTLFDDQAIFSLEEKLRDVRHRLFSAKTPTTKRKLREEDRSIRENMAALLVKTGWGNETARQLAGWDPYDQNKTISFFDPEWMFGCANGFDIVIGNPPYGAQISEQEKNYFNSNFKYQSYQLDSYLLFIEKSMALTRANGCLSLIIPNTWLLNLFSKNLRNWLFSEKTIRNVVHFVSSVFAAIVDTEVVVYLNEKPSVRHQIQISIVDGFEAVNTFEIPQSRWQSQGGEPVNVLSKPEFSGFIDKLRKFPTLNDICIITQGSKPFQVGKGRPPQTRAIVDEKPFVAATKVDKTFKPLLRGSLINRYKILWDKDYWISFGDWLAEPRYSASYDAPEKIVIRQTGDSLVATLDTQQFIVRDNLYTIIPKTGKTNLRVVLAFINSSLLKWYYQKVLNPEEGEALAQVKKGHLVKLPIPAIDKKLEQDIASLVDQILSSYKSGEDSKGLMLERSLDKVIFKCFGLTPEEIQAIG